MATFDISTPDGASYEIDAPDEMSAFDAFKKMQGVGWQSKESIPIQTKEEPKGLIAAGAAGAARSVAAMPGILGDIQELSRAGGRTLGFEPPKRSILDLAASQAGLEKLPTSETTIEAAKKFAPGIGYQPQTVGEEYASTIGSFLPAALMSSGPGAVNKLRGAIQYGAVPAVGSEALGQATKGTAAEPWARAAGALAGATVGPSITNIPGRVVSPLTQSPRVAAQAALLEREGLPLTAGQRTGNKFLKLGEAVAADVTGTDLNLPQSEAFTRAATRRMGYESPQMTDANWQAARQNLNQTYDQLASRNTLQMDRQFATDMGDAVTDFVSRTPVHDRPEGAFNHLRDILDIAQSGGQLPGGSYQAWRSRLDKLRQGSRNRPEVADFYGNMRAALDNAMERSLAVTNPEDAALWRQTNQRWGALKTLQQAGKSAGEEAAQGYIPSAQLRNAVANRSPTQYLEGRSDLGNLAQAARAVMTPYPSSGTQQRTMMQKILSGGGGTAAAGAGLGSLMGGPQEALIGAAIGAAGPYLASRGLLSAPMQAYLGNQAASRFGLLANQNAAQRVRGLTQAYVSSQRAMQR